MNLDMGAPETIAKLRELLAELGVRTLDGPAEEPEAFPLHIALADGGSLTLDLPQPGLLANLDPRQVGGAIVDPLGRVRASWGLAKRTPYLRASSKVLNGQLGPLFEAAFQGDPGALYLDGFRYFAAVASNSPCRDVFVLVTNAGEERTARRQATKSAREAAALKRVGSVLTMNVSTRNFCGAAAHEIVSASELAAALLWTADPETGELSLAAHVGVNRQGTTLLRQLSLDESPTCIAELVATTRKPFVAGNVLENVMTSQLEARFTYLSAGGVCAMPLIVGPTLVGVLELIGKAGDAHFMECRELFQTVSEHLALALNSAILFESLAKMAWHDPVTGIANHRSMHEFLRGRLAEASREEQPVGLAMIDVDNFRSFNEEEGHETGDAVLRMVAEAIKEAVREYDLAARYGGEEFTAVLPGADRATTLAIAERIRKRVESLTVTTLSGRDRHVTVSIGCAVFPESAQDAAALLRAADSALFEAKRLGKNDVVVFEGTAPTEEDRHERIVDRCWRWVAKGQRAHVEARLARLEPTLCGLAVALKLSKSQERILRALCVVREAYEAAARARSGRRLHAMESSEDFRLMLPSLATLDERFDGTGPQGIPGKLQPLLARVLSAAWALDEEGPQALVSDPGRFDPEIVATLVELASAA